MPSFDSPEQRVTITEHISDAPRESVVQVTMWETPDDAESMLFQALYALFDRYAAEHERSHEHVLEVLRENYMAHDDRVIDEARDWLWDASIMSLNGIQCLDDVQIRHSIDTHYEGGWKAFISRPKES